MKVKATLTMAAVALLALLATVPAFAHMADMPAGAHRGHGSMMGMGHMDRMGNMMGMCMEHAEMMGLSDDQLMKMKPVHGEMQKKQAQFEADLKIAEIELMDIMDVKDFDLEKAGAAVKKIEGIKTAHQSEMLKAMKKMRAGLTDEQFKKMKKMMVMKADDNKHD